MIARRSAWAWTLALFAGIASLAGAQTPQTLYVDVANGGVQDGSIEAPFRTIGGAMALVVADRGDTILVRPGTYAERVTVKAGTLLASEAGAARTFIVGTPSVPADQVTLERASTLRGFSVGETGGAAVRVPVNGSAEITNCVLYASEQGVLAEVNSLLECVNNTFFNNSTGLSAGPGADVTPFKNNIVSSNATGVFIGDGGSVIAAYNGFFNNTTAVSGGFPGDSDFASNPLFVNTQGLNFHLRESSNMRDAGDPAVAFNDRDGTRNDVGADGGATGSLDTLAPQIFATSFPAPAQGDAPLAVLFDARASQDEWGVAAWEWDFDARDGVSVEGFGATVPVLYNEPGGYLVTLLVTDNSGFQSSATYSVRVGNPPAVSIDASPRTGPAPLPINFSANVSSGDDLTFEWDVDSDGVTDASGATLAYTYPVGTVPGVYFVTLTATDGAGVVTQVQRPITITEFAVATSADLSAGAAAVLTINDSASPINGARVTVPTNSVNRPVTVAVSAVTEDDLALKPSGAIAALINVSPSNLVFSRSVRVQVPLPADLEDVAGLQVRYYDPAAQAWFGQGISSVRVSNTTPRTVSFETAHFTTFAVTVESLPEEPKQMACAGGEGRASASQSAGDLALVLGLVALLVVQGWRQRGARVQS